MWTTGAKYRRDEDSDGFQMSPCLTASSGLLTPPATYNIDARRDSNASSLSSLGPTTPVYGRNPFSDHGYASVPNMETCQDPSMDAIGISNFSFKSEETSYENWPSLAQSDSMDHNLPMRVHQGFAAHPGLGQSRMPTFTSVDSVVASTPTSCATSFSSSPYAEYHGPMHSEPDHVQNPEGMWSSHQYSPTNMLAPPTMASTEALLGGEYVQLDTASQDAEMSPYNDIDVPLAHSPHGIVVKHEEGKTSAMKRKVRRSIWVSSTGGESVKKEGQTRATKQKSRKPPVTHHGDRFDLIMDDDVVQIPGTKKWRRNGGGSSGKPQICQMPNMQNAGVPCGRKFQRQEHLHRHMKTHSGRKDFACHVKRCTTRFNRNDNCWEHYWTHVHRPGKKNGRNQKYSLKRVLTYITDPKHIEKLLVKWEKEVGYEYNALTDPVAIKEREDDEAASSSADDHLTSERDKSVVKSRL